MPNGSGHVPSKHKDVTEPGDVFQRNAQRLLCMPPQAPEPALRLRQLGRPGASKAGEVESGRHVGAATWRSPLLYYVSGKASEKAVKRYMDWRGSRQKCPEWSWVKSNWGQGLTRLGFLVPNPLIIRWNVKDHVCGGAVTDTAAMWGREYSSPSCVFASTAWFLVIWQWASLKKCSGSSSSFS